MGEFVVFYVLLIVLLVGSVGAFTWILIGEHLECVRTRTLKKLLAAGYRPFIRYGEEIWWELDGWTGKTRAAIRRERVQGKLKQYALSGKFDIVSKNEEPTQIDWRQE